MKKVVITGMGKNTKHPKTILSDENHQDDYFAQSKGCYWLEAS